jgi:hypothetical protein
VAYLGLENGYNDAPLLFAKFYLLWTILAMIWFRPIFTGAMRRISLRADAVAVLPLVVVFGGFILLVLPALPEIAVSRAPADPPEFMFASAWYYLPKSFDILFQQVLTAAVIRTAAGQGFSLVATSIGMAALFGGFHLMLAFDGFTPTYVLRFTIAATLFGLLAPYRYLRMRRGFLWAYGLHWSFYALDATTTHFVPAVWRRCKFKTYLSYHGFAAALLLGTAMAYAEVDTSLFSADAMVKPPETVDCTLTTGEAAHCALFVVKYLPDNLEIGPFCLTTLDETGGILDWDGDNPGVYRLNRAVFEMLSGLGYTFYDEAGNIYITDPGSGSPPAQDNTCLSATADEAVEMTMRIPLTPVVADTPTDLGTVAKVSIALDGVPVFADLPSVLETGHMPAMDTCGGHIDPGGWYHWLGTATDMKTVFDDAALDAECGLAQSAGRSSAMR